MPTGRVRHRQPASDELARGNVDDATAVCLIGSPASGSVGDAEGRDIPRLTVDERQAVEMAAVFGSESGDKGRPPTGDKAVIRAKSGQTGETCAHHPQFVTAVGNFVY